MLSPITFNSIYVSPADRNYENVLSVSSFVSLVDRHIFKQQKPHAVWSAVETHQERNISNTN